MTTNHDNQISIDEILTAVNWSNQPKNLD